MPYLDVSHVHSTENPKDLGGDTLQVCLGADQATGGQFLDDVQENGQRPGETELGGFVDLTVGRGGLGGVADDGGQLGEDLGPVERVFETGDFADNYGVLDGELGDRLGDGGGDEAGAEVGLFLVTYGAGEGQSVAGGGGERRKKIEEERWPDPYLLAVFRQYLSTPCFRVMTDSQRISTGSERSRKTSWRARIRANS